MPTVQARGSRFTRPAVVAAALLLVLALLGLAGLFGLFKSDKRAAEQALGVSLPPTAADVRFYRDQPNPDLALYTAYLRFRTTRDDYLDLMRRMQVRTYPGSAPELRQLLPGKWQADPRLQLEWWDPGADIPDDTAMGSFGVSGWLVGKYARGQAYVEIHDTGVAQ